AFCRRDADALLLDEPTARLDGRSEAAIIEATRALARGRTAVIVAHRPAMIALADRVVRLDAGKVVSDDRVPLAISGTDFVPAPGSSPGTVPASAAPLSASAVTGDAAPGSLPPSRETGSASSAPLSPSAATGDAASGSLSPSR